MRLIGAATALTAIAGAGPAAASTPDHVDVQLRVLAPAFPDVGLTSSTLRFPRALTETERRGLRVRVTNPSPERIVVGASKFRDHGRELVVTVAAAWIRSREGRRRHAFGVDATADVPGGPFMWGDPGAMAMGPGFNFRGTSPSAAAAALDDPCAGLEQPLRGSDPAVLYSSPPNLMVPARPVRNGSRFVSNLTPAGLFLDQVVGRLCHPPFDSPWLRRTLTRTR